MKYTAAGHLWRLRYLIVAAALLVLAMFFIPGMIADRFVTEMENQRKASLQKIIDIAYNTSYPILQKVETKEIPLVQGREEVAELLRQMTYQDEFGENYIFMAGYEGTLLVQPYLQQPEGTLLFDVQDSHGKFYFREMLHIAESPSGEGFLKYHYLPPAKANEEEKLSYIRSMPQLNAFIGTGVYLESSYLQLNAILDQQRWFFIGMTILIVTLFCLNLWLLLQQNKLLRLEIDDRIAVESKLSASEARYKTLFMAANDGILLIRDGIIADCNPRAEEMFDAPRDQLLGKSPAALSPEFQEDQQPSQYLASKYLSYTSEGKALSFEWIHQKPRGDVFYCEVTLSLMSLVEGDYTLAILRDISERKEAEIEFRRLAFIDSLTNLPNRISVMNSIKRNTDSCITQNCQGTLFYIDIDDFKIINDTFSHAVGDMVLVQVADLLHQAFDAMDEFFVGRLGGDEFTVICEGQLTTEGVIKTAESILSLFEKPVKVKDYSFKIGASIGIVHYPQDGKTAEVLLKNADLSMYEAKRRGRNRYIIYNGDIAERFEKEISLERAINAALEKGELSIVYQPQIELQEEALSGFEALLRWHSPVHGEVPPAEFIPLAEKTGAISEITFWILEEACRFAYDMRLRIDKLPTVTINISPVQFMQSGLVERFSRIMAKYELAPKSIGIEITESLFIEGGEETIATLEELKNQGFRIYLDDFGTGYSSLNYLKTLPLEVVKIDKTFIDDAVDNAQSSTILSTIIQLGHELGLMVVAEGVETSSQVDYLKRYQCNCIQGYFFSKPLPRELALKMAIDRKVQDCGANLFINKY